MKVLRSPLEFEWDKGNSGKNFQTHNVTDGEYEEVFFDPNKKVARDAPHSKGESRDILLGQTKKSRLLFVVFTVRKKLVRVISARDLNKKEKKLYL
ncbi:BrnT family toxin [Patescibacteria group bacterium]|nr:BrnT family toxin [Patescibacteria group bacterium]